MSDHEQARTRCPRCGALTYNEPGDGCASCDRSDLEITLPNGVKMTFMQMLAIDRLGRALGEFEWHPNDCGCCFTVHPKGQHDRGYIVDRAGGSEWLELGHNGRSE